MCFVDSPPPPPPPQGQTQGNMGCMTVSDDRIPCSIESSDLRIMESPEILRLNLWHRAQNLFNGEGREKNKPGDAKTRSQSGASFLWGPKNCGCCKQRVFGQSSGFSLMGAGNRSGCLSTHFAIERAIRSTMVHSHHLGLSLTYLHDFTKVTPSVIGCIETIPVSDFDNPTFKSKWNHK